MDIPDQTEELDPIEIAEELTVEEYFVYIGLTRKKENDNLKADDIKLPF